MSKELNDEFDTGDEKQVGERKVTYKLTREKEIAEFYAILGTYGGRAFIWRLLTECKIYEFGYCGDNNYLNNLEGKRVIGGWVIKEVDETNPKAYALMRDEAVSRDTERKGKR